MKPTVQQKVKDHRPKIVGVRRPQGAPSVTESTTYRPHNQVELVNSGKQFRQKQGEPLAAWLLQLWDRGVDGVICSGDKTG